MDRIQVGKNLKSWGIEKFGKLTILAEKLGMMPQSLQKYTSGKALPGAGMIAKLKELGCDTDWLLLSIVYPTQHERIIAGDEPLDGDKLLIKDKIILNQAEQIQKLKDKVIILEIKVEELTKEAAEIEKDLGFNGSGKIKKKRN